MQISPLFTRAATNSGTTTSGVTAGAIIGQSDQNQAVDQNAFLKLLSTQLSNQDPTQPQDQSQFLAQLAQFSTVQGVNNLQASQTQLQATDMLGKQIQASVVVNNVPQNVSGTVASVSWNSSGVSLTLNDANKTVVNLSQVTQVTN